MAEKWEFQGIFNATQILEGLKKVRNELSSKGVKNNLFQAVDKDIDQADKLIANLLAQIQSGFRNNKEISDFSKEFNKMDGILSRINVRLKDINVTDNFKNNSKEINSLSNELNSLSVTLNNIKTEVKNGLGDIGLFTPKELKTLKTAINENEDLAEAIKKVGQARETTAKTNIKSLEEGNLEKIRNNINTAINSKNFSNTASKINFVTKQKTRGSIAPSLREGKGTLAKQTINKTKAIAVLEAELPKILEKVALNGQNTETVLNQLQKRFQDSGAAIDDTNSALENFINKTLKNIQGIINSSATQETKQKDFSKQLGSTNRNGQYVFSGKVQEFVNNQNVQDLPKVIQQYTDTISLYQKTREEFDQKVNQTVIEQGQNLNNVKTEQEELRRSTSESTEELKEQATAAEELDNSFDRVIGTIKNLLSVGTVFTQLKNVITQTFNDVQELDKSFAQIAMVTEYSIDDMWESYDSYADMAKELGQTTESVVKASGLFYQQGLDTADSLKLTESTLKLATLAGLDFDEATAKMTAALRGFHMEMDQGEHVTDVYSELAAHAAADVNGIAYAMSKTASIANSAGMSFENTSAFITQMIETTQEAPKIKLIA